MKYVCGVCGYVYDEEKEGIPFSELTDGWQCPLCRASKTAFGTENAVNAAEAFVPDADGDLKELSPGQLAALCTGLSRGCEKQYRQDEAGLFRELADYFSSEVPEKEEADVSVLSGLLLDDIRLYPGIRAVADENGDRGAARALVWGEKVTRMLSSLVDRYLNEGGDFPKGTGIWLCTACGFVYTGDRPPEKCPVCKVPADRFEKIGGGEPV